MNRAQLDDHRDALRKNGWSNADTEAFLNGLVADENTNVRDLFIAAALTGLTASGHTFAACVAIDAVNIADAAMKARAK